MTISNQTNRMNRIKFKLKINKKLLKKRRKRKRKTDDLIDSIKNGN